MITVTSPIESRFGVTWVVPSPPSSPTDTPSIVVFLLRDVPPLMLSPRPDCQAA
ncbi:MAG TPA: hypothetical protein VL914_02930 [Vicinamibacterales bacterium]|nr:hypothetical protein [Vicinamibacterales bacterium]